MTTPLCHVLADVRYVWYGPSLLITTARGECSEQDFLTGFYFREARHLSALRLEVNGAAPWLCAEGVTSQHQLDFVYVYPELTQFGGGGTDVSDDTTLRDPHGVIQRGIDVRVRERVRFDGSTSGSSWRIERRWPPISRSPGRSPPISPICKRRLPARVSRRRRWSESLSSTAFASDMAIRSCRCRR